MGDDDLVALRDQVDDGLCSLGDEGELLIGGVAQRVAAEGDDDSLAHVTCSLHVADGGDHDGLDGVHAVLRLVEDLRVRGEEDLVRDLADVPCDVRNLRHHLLVGGTFHCYHFHGLIHRIVFKVFIY